jgi:hypothetical protein
VRAETAIESDLLASGSGSGSGSVAAAESSANANDLHLHDHEYVHDVRGRGLHGMFLSYAGQAYFVLERSRCANGPWVSHQSLHAETVIGLLQILLVDQRLHQIQSSRRLQVRIAYLSLGLPSEAAHQTDFVHRMADFA